MALLAILVSVSRCATSKTPLSSPKVPVRIIAEAVDPSGVVWWATSDNGRCSLNSAAPGGEPARKFEIPSCPEAIDALGDGSLFLGTGEHGELRTADGSLLSAERNIVAARDRTHFAEQAGGLRLQWGERSLALPGKAKLRRAVLSHQAPAVWGIVNKGASEALLMVDESGEHVVFSAPVIDSFALSPDESEAVLSALHDGSLDPVIVSADGSKSKWVSLDPLAETNVTWAPRGHKISFVVHTSGGSLVRTVHVPTAFAVAVSFPFGSVLDTRWEPKAERLVILFSTPTTPARIDLVSYQAGEHQAVARSAPDVPGEAEPLSWKGGSVVVLAPAALRYGARVPVIIWKESKDVFAFNAAATRLREEYGVGLIISPGGVSLDAAFWAEVSSLPWVDPARTFVVERRDTHPRYPDHVQTVVLGAAPADGSGGDALESSAVSRLEMLLKGKNRVDGRS